MIRQQLNFQRNLFTMSKILLTVFGGIFRLALYVWFASTYHRLLKLQIIKLVYPQQLHNCFISDECFSWRIDKWWTSCTSHVGATATGRYRSNFSASTAVWQVYLKRHSLLQELHEETINYQIKR